MGSLILAGFHIPLQLKLFVGLKHSNIQINDVSKDTYVCKAYYGNQFLFKSRLVSKKLKMKLYWSIVRPTVTYGCETWRLKDTVKNKLMAFGRKAKKYLWS